MRRYMQFILFFSLSACSASEVTADEVQPILDAVETELVRITDTPIPGEVHGLADTMDIFVSADVEADYRTITRDNPESSVVFAERTVLVKEQYDADGAFNSFTVMVKGPDGQNPDVGDWWFGFAGEDGVVAEGPAACGECHQGRPDSDYVYGL